MKPGWRWLNANLSVSTIPITSPQNSNAPLRATSTLPPTKSLVLVNKARLEMAKREPKRINHTNHLPAELKCAIARYIDTPGDRASGSYRWSPAGGGQTRPQPKPIERLPAELKCAIARYIDSSNDLKIHLFPRTISYNDDRISV
jgi:hypothetical protein